MTRRQGELRVLVVEDSPSMGALLAYILESDPGLSIVATVKGDIQAMDCAMREKPDVLVVDIHAARMGGVESVRRIFTAYPVPTVIVTDHDRCVSEEFGFLAREAGASVVCERPKGITHPLFLALALRIVEAVKAASRLKAVCRWNQSKPMRRKPFQQGTRGRAGRLTVGIVVIGASTGGPPVLCEILSGLDPGFPVPLLIVQHIAPGFIGGMVDWLSSTSGFPVEIARGGMTPKPGRAYIAPDGLQMEIRLPGTLRLAPGMPVNGMCPSVSVLFRSAAETFGDSAIGILLSGMGRDGAEELAFMKRAGALTIVQDKATSTVFGMPGEAVKLGASCLVLPPGEIVRVLGTCTASKAVR